MEKSSVFVLLGLILLISESCERSTTNWRSDYLIIGSTANVLVDRIDTILINGHYNIDLDTDGRYDLRLASYIRGSSHFPNYGSSIECLNDEAKLLLSATMDTTYYCCSHDQIIDDYNGKIAIIYYNNYQCFKSSEEDSIVSIQEIMEVQDIDVGDTLNKMKTFAPDTVDFGKHWTTMEQTILYESDDTIIWQNDSFECYKYRTKNGETVYFGFEYKDRFGWIKLGITNNFQISIFEVVIQE